MKSNTQLRLSLHTVPELSIGRAPLTPQNSQFDPRRLHYLEGMVAYLNGLFDNLQKHHSRAEALSRLENGQNANPTLDTLWRYAAALGKRLLLGAAEIAPTRAPAEKAVPRTKR